MQKDLIRQVTEEILACDAVCFIAPDCGVIDETDRLLACFKYSSECDALVSVNDLTWKARGPIVVTRFIVWDTNDAPVTYIPALKTYYLAVNDQIVLPRGHLHIGMKGFK